MGLLPEDKVKVFENGGTGGKLGTTLGSLGGAFQFGEVGVASLGRAPLGWGGAGGGGVLKAEAIQGDLALQGQVNAVPLVQLQANLLFDRIRQRERLWFLRMLPPPPFNPIPCLLHVWNTVSRAESRAVEFELGF